MFSIQAPERTTFQTQISNLSKTELRNEGKGVIREHTRKM